MADPFALPPVTPKSTKAIKAATDYIHDMARGRADARDIIIGLVKHHGASLTHPSYRTALRCGGIYTEAASACELFTAKILLSSFVEKSDLYLQDAGQKDLFAGVGDGRPLNWRTWDEMPRGSADG